MMKIQKNNSRTMKMIFSIFSLVMILSFIVPETKTNFAISSIVPAARGSVKIKKDGIHNFKIRISVSNLLNVASLSPPKHIYVVWMVTDQFITKNIGHLSSVPSSMNTMGSGTLEATSSLKPSKFFISAEEDTSIQHPGVQVVLATNRF